MSAQGGPFKDHFSGHASDYARARPHYPQELFHFLAACCRRRERAWDCATGNGQAAVALREHFATVVASDASERQVSAAQAQDGVEYRVAAAEASGLDDGSVDLVTVAQALHWFDIERFFGEAGRVLRSGGVLAVWCYGNCQVEPACDRVVQGLYEALAPWWPPERAIVESGYSGIELPFPALDCPRFAMRQHWRAEELLAYIGTWSASQRCRADTGRDPLQAIVPALEQAWGRGSRDVHWPLYLKVARKP